MYRFDLSFNTPLKYEGPRGDSHYCLSESVYHIPSNVTPQHGRGQRRLGPREEGDLP